VIKAVGLGGACWFPPGPLVPSLNLCLVVLGRGQQRFLSQGVVTL